MYQVSSEIYKETNFRPVKGVDGKVVSKFKFRYPNEDDGEEFIESRKQSFSPAKKDQDGDLVVNRKKRTTPKRITCEEIEIEHSEATDIKHVGLQVWRGALLLADFFFYRRKEFSSAQILELGAGVGLTSIAAAIYSNQVICTDVDIGGILDLIRANVKRNSKLFKGNVQVLECDFMQNVADYGTALVEAVDGSDVIVAADVIYDNDLTDAFINVIDYIFQRSTVIRKRKTIYIALEKRFVFTFSELDSVAPMFEYFVKQTMEKPWHFEYIATNFPQYFEYERSKELVLIKLTCN